MTTHITRHVAELADTEPAVEPTEPSTGDVIGAYVAAILGSVAVFLLCWGLAVIS